MSAEEAAVEQTTTKFNGTTIFSVVSQCEGCDRVKEIDGGKYCTSYPQPQMKWKLGACNFATHVKATVDKQGKVKVNPLKASKRAARGR